MKCKLCCVLFHGRYKHEEWITVPVFISTEGFAELSQQNTFVCYQVAGSRILKVIVLALLEFNDGICVWGVLDADKGVRFFGCKNKAKLVELKLPGGKD